MTGDGYAFEDADVIEPMTAPERRRKYRRDHSDRVAERRERDYLSRPFVAWDGEGITGDDGVHRYVMLAVRTADGDSDDLHNVNGIPTVTALDFIHGAAQSQPANAIHVIYGGSYDFNMIMRDLPRAVLKRLYDGEYTWYDEYKLRWRRGKSLWIARYDLHTRRRIGHAVTIFDVVSFFQCAFVKACDSYLGDAFIDRDMIVENKALRSAFTVSDIPQVRRYNDAELANLLNLMTELRDRLNRVGLRPRRWDGPGAVAAELLRRENVKAAIGPVPEAVAEAARYAYAGGRFEVIRFGARLDRTWEYDVNSAYPTALRHVPDLTAGRWEHVHGDPGPAQFAVYHVAYEGRNARLPGALFCRLPRGSICYPPEVTGWYWSPEVDAARAYCDAGHGTMHVIEAWVFHENPGASRPFAFIDELYRQRRALKAAGDGAHVGVKLGLNSLYGKLAQQVGARYNSETGEWRLPPFHCLEWAGFVTAWCRARVLTAVLPVLDRVIAFETDAVFVECPLDVPQGSDLGEFEPVLFEDLTYVQSGLYFGNVGGTEVAKTRGIDRGSLSRETVEDAMFRPIAAERHADASLTRFVGAGIALAQNMDRWLRWERVTKTLTLQPTGKRDHLDCECLDELTDLLCEGRAHEWRMPVGMHDTICPYLEPGHSSQFPIAWINPDPAMTELTDMRETEPDYE